MVTTSSAVGAIAYQFSRRSPTRNIIGPYASLRPDCSHSSIGWRIGKVTSWAPASSISSRTICPTLRSTRSPNGSHE